MMFSPVSVHQELSEKQKPPTHQGGGLQSSGGDLFSEFPHHTSSETFDPDQGHLSSPLPGCQTRLRVVPDAASNRTEPVSAYNKNLCHSRKPALSDKRVGDLISDALPFGCLWYGEPNAVSNAINYAKNARRSN